MTGRGAGVRAGPRIRNSARGKDASRTRGDLARSVASYLLPRPLALPKSSNSESCRASLETTQVYKGLTIQQLREVHARYHPRGRKNEPTSHAAESPAGLLPTPNAPMLPA